MTGIVAVFLLPGGMGTAHGAELRVGAATVSITPDRPVALRGHHRTRIAREVRSPVTATALALEAREDGEAVDRAIIVSCDLCVIPRVLTEAVRARAAERIQGLEVRKAFLCATHTHTAPQMIEGMYNIPEKGVMQPAEYVDFAAGRISEAMVRAWESREPGAVGWGLGHAIVAHSRRPVYADGQARMHGATHIPDFRRLEGFADHGVHVLFLWDEERDPVAIVVNVACPAQAQTGSKRRIFADYWHHVRESLRDKYGDDVSVVGLCGASGEHTPLLQYRESAERRMREARGNRLVEEAARRIVNAVREAHEVARTDIRSDLEFAHTVREIELPRRRITEDQYKAARAKLETLESEDPPPDNLVNHRYRIRERVLQAYRMQDQDYRMELHALRLGDVAICSNDFELFADFGVQIQARSPALQTIVVQLAGPGLYVPTRRAVEHGVYSTGVEETVLGPEGGQSLADQTVKTLEALWVER